MSKSKKTSKRILMEVNSKLSKTGAALDTLLYVSLYHTALALQSTGKYKLSTDVCRALLKELERGDKNKNQEKDEIKPLLFDGSFALNGEYKLNGIKVKEPPQEHGGQKD